MSRPHKYATAQLAAENYLYSNMRGQLTGLSMEEYIELVSRPCSICHGKPSVELPVTRADGTYVLRYNYLHTGKPVCKLCRALVSVASMQEVRSYAARILALRKHELDMKPFIMAQD